ncbi:siderophore-interacting protein [Microbacterium sp. SORGH_AS_0862]|uniref:siderophore-interacting protein n=1 Tax=Microbacterium sp. SORGH_AS_0862 TaxID=3041789 RepID=UPI002791D255|nr:siderophore-interacting protein [Microbacterium sp. SORGH_AS_0862]MDQ1206707.1 NADPH-dependent ferric siderophore reductase [Microbacterium sp. SORGH_AS_0862]
MSRASGEEDAERDLRGTRIEVVPTLGRRLLRVVSARHLAPRYRRITFRAEDLHDGFPFRAFAPTDHVKLFFPDPASGRLAVPVVTDRGWHVPPELGTPIFRDYTVRGYEREAGELTIDFVVHPHGIAGSWAARARPGDEIGQLGPRGNILFPTDYPHYLAAGDETALPAIMRVLEEAPIGSRVTAVVEVDGAADEQPLDVRDGVDADIRWVHRHGARAVGGAWSPLEAAIRSVPLPDSEPAFVFVAGEATVLTPIRRYLRRELGLAKERVDVDGYWKQGVTNLDHHAEIDDDS